MTEGSNHITTENQSTTPTPPQNPQFTDRELLEAITLFESHIPKIAMSDMIKNVEGANACLRYLRETEKTSTAKEMSKALDVSTARMTALLKKLAQQGDIKKIENPQDGREKVVSLTPQGVEKAYQSRMKQYETMKTILSIYPMEELKSLFHKLDTIHSIILATKNIPLQEPTTIEEPTPIEESHPLQEPTPIEESHPLQEPTTIEEPTPIEEKEETP